MVGVLLLNGVQTQEVNLPPSGQASPGDSAPPPDQHEMSNAQDVHVDGRDEEEGDLLQSNCVSAGVHRGATTFNHSVIFWCFVKQLRLGWGALRSGEHWGRPLLIIPSTFGSCKATASRQFCKATASCKATESCKAAASLSIPWTRGAPRGGGHPRRRQRSGHFQPSRQLSGLVKWPLTIIPPAFRFNEAATFNHLSTFGFCKVTPFCQECTAGWRAPGTCPQKALEDDQIKDVSCHFYQQFYVDSMAFQWDIVHQHPSI